MNPCETKVLVLGFTRFLHFELFGENQKLKGKRNWLRKNLSFY